MLQSTGLNVYQAVSANEAAFEAEVPPTMMAPVEGPRSIDERMMELFFTAGVAFGENRRALKDELAGLESNNRILVAEITQLTLVHAAELNATVDGYLAARNLIIEKLKGIIERLKSFPEHYQRCEYIPFNTGPFQEIVDKISSPALECHYSELRKYPEYVDKRKMNNPKEEQIVCVSAFDTTLLVQPMLARFTNEIEGLEARVAPLRAENHSLVEKREIMIDFHWQYLEDLNRIEKLGKLKGIVNRIRAAYDNVKWKVPETVGYDCNFCYWDNPDQTSPVMQKFRPLLHKKKQELVNEKLHDVQEHILMAVEALEALTL